MQPKQISYSTSLKLCPLVWFNFIKVIFLAYETIFIAGNSITQEDTEVLQRKLLRRCLGLMNSTPNLFVYLQISEQLFREELILIKSILKDETQIRRISYKRMIEHIQDLTYQANRQQRNNPVSLMISKQLQYIQIIEKKLSPLSDIEQIHCSPLNSLIIWQSPHFFRTSSKLISIMKIGRNTSLFIHVDLVHHQE